MYAKEPQAPKRKKKREEPKKEAIKPISLFLSRFSHPGDSYQGRRKTSPSYTFARNMNELALKKKKKERKKGLPSAPVRYFAFRRTRKTRSWISFFFPPLKTPLLSESLFLPAPFHSAMMDRLSMPLFDAATSEAIRRKCAHRSHFEPHIRNFPYVPDDRRPPIHLFIPSFSSFLKAIACLSPFLCSQRLASTTVEISSAKKRKENP